SCLFSARLWCRCRRRLVQRLQTPHSCRHQNNFRKYAEMISFHNQAFWRLHSPPASLFHKQSQETRSQLQENISYYCLLNISASFLSKAGPRRFLAIITPFGSSRSENGIPVML